MLQRKQMHMNGQDTLYVQSSKRGFKTLWRRKCFGGETSSRTQALMNS